MQCSLWELPSAAFIVSPWISCVWSYNPESINLLELFIISWFIAALSFFPNHQEQQKTMEDEVASISLK